MWTRPDADMGMDTVISKHLYQRCVKLVRDLEISFPLDIQTLCAHLHQSRGRQIHLLPVALPPDSFSGLWISTENADYIIYQKETSVPHQNHIILHEIGHLLCKHEGALILGIESTLILPDLHPQIVREMLGRSHYSAKEEQEAEVVASIIAQQMTSPSDQDQESRQDGSTAVVGRIERSLRPYHPFPWST